MFIKYSLNPYIIEGSKEQLLLVAQERHLGDKQALLKLLLEIDWLSTLCSKLNTAVILDNDECVSFLFKASSDEIDTAIVSILDTARMMNKTLKGLIPSFSRSVGLFTANFKSEDLKSIKHYANNTLLDTYLRQNDFLESGIAEYAFYSNGLKPLYPEFILAVKDSVQLLQDYNRGIDSYNDFNEESYKPLFNNGRVGVVKQNTQRAMDDIAQDVKSRALDLFGENLITFNDEERRIYNKAYKTMEEAPYSACLLMYKLFELAFDSSPAPLRLYVDEIGRLMHENRTLSILLLAYAKHLNWLVKEVSNSSYALLHHLLERNSKLYAEYHERQIKVMLPEAVYALLENDFCSNEEMALKQRIKLVMGLRENTPAMASVFKLFQDAVNYYTEIEKLAKAKGNHSPIADISMKQYLPLFHNPNLSSDIDFKSYRQSLVAA